MTAKTKKALDKGKQQLITFLDWFLYIIGYTIVFIVVTSFFRQVYIDSNHLIIWSAIIVIILYLLNKTVKPILVTLTIPITGLTLGLFYPCINMFILKLVDWMLGKHFQIANLWIALFLALLLSITNLIMEKVLDNLIEKVKKHE